MRIDAHHHLWDLSKVHYPWLTARGQTRFFGDPAPIQRNYLLQEFTADAKANGFHGSVHVQVGAEDSLAEAQWVQSVADANSHWPLVQVAYCDLSAPDLSAQLDALQCLPSIRGVRQIVGRAPGEDALTGTNTLLDDPAFAKGLASLAERDLCFDLQLLPELMAKTAEVLKQAPNTKIALCHAGSPYDRSPEGLTRWQRSLAALSEQAQVTCKLSGLGMFEHNWTSQSFAPIIECVFNQFGPDRVMFGSNFPVDSLTSTYKDLLETYVEHVPQSAREAFFGGVADRFYRVTSAYVS